MRSRILFHEPSGNFFVPVGLKKSLIAFGYLLSLCLLLAAFPGLKWAHRPLLAFVALVPLLLVARQVQERWWRWLANFIFFEIFLQILLPWPRMAHGSTIIGSGAYWGLLCFYALAPLIWSGSLAVSEGLALGHSPGFRPWFVALAWTMGEYLYFVLPFPFPLSMATALYDQPLLIQICSVTGIQGLAFAIIWVNAALAELIEAYHCGNDQRGLLARQTLIGGLIFLTLSVWLFYKPYQVQARALKLAVIQPNRSWLQSVAENFLPAAMQGHTRKMLDLTQQAITCYQPDLVFWNERSVKSGTLDRELNQGLAHLSQGNPNLGVVLGHDMLIARSVENSVSLWSAANGWSAAYVKQRRVPFFEQSASVVDASFSLPLRDQIHPAIGAMICFESLFPQVALGHVRHGALILADLSNDSFFGKSNWVLLHATYAVLRAVELRRPFVVSNNTGFSLIVDHRGRILLRTVPGQAGIGCATIHPVRHRSLYQWCPWCFPLLCLGASLVRVGQLAVGAADKARPASKVLRAIISNA